MRISKEAYPDHCFRFIEEYALQDVPIWGVTIQNEPAVGGDDKWEWQAMYFPPEVLFLRGMVSRYGILYLGSIRVRFETSGTSVANIKVCRKDVNNDS